MKTFTSKIEWLLLKPIKSMMMKVLSHPHHGNSKCCIMGNCWVVDPSGLHIGSEG